MARITDPVLTVNKKEHSSGLNVKFDLKISKEEFIWLLGKTKADVRVMCTIYGKDEDKQDKLLFNYVHELDEVENAKGAQQAIKESLPVSFTFKVSNSKLDEDKMKDKITTRIALKRDVDEIYAVVYLSLQKGEGSAWEAITPAAASNVVQERF